MEGGELRWEGRTRSGGLQRECGGLHADSRRRTGHMPTALMGRVGWKLEQRDLIII